MATVFSGKVALVTGGASGIGAALAQELARRGAIVLVADRQLELAGMVVDAIRAGGGTAEVCELDVRDFGAWQSLAEAIEARYGALDYLFNNAGIAIGAEVKSMDISEWDSIIDVNINGVANGIQAFYPGMVARGSGHIINTASMAGLTVNPGVTAYSMTKYAVVGLSLSLRAEAADSGVNVTALCPGVIRTPILEDGGRFGKIHGFDPRAVEQIWKVVRPMDVNRFAVQALNEVARNPAIIVLPRAWKLAWWLGRVSPALQAQSVRLMLRLQKRMERRFRNAG